MENMTHIPNRVFFLEISQPSGKPIKTLAVGIVIMRLEDEDSDGEWGRLSFHDQISQRQRVISLLEEPEVSENQIIALSDVGASFYFSFVTKEIFEEKVKPLFQIPENLEPKLIDTKEVQTLLLNLYP